MKKNFYLLVLVIISIFGINLKAFAKSANDWMYEAKKVGLVMSTNTTRHFVYVDGYAWSQIPYEEKRGIVYMFADYMKTKAKDKGAFVDVKDYNSGEKYAIMSPLGYSKIYK